MTKGPHMVHVDRARSRTFVVTGAASGIGLATARRLLAEGGSVVGADLASPPDLGPNFHFVTADVSGEDAVAAVFAAVSGRLDGVFHAAGVAGGGPVHLLDRAEWDRVIGINLTGTFLVAKAALAAMIEQERAGGERGSIVTVASIEGLEGTAGEFLQRRQGRCRAAHQEHCSRLRPERHPGERDLPRLHRYPDGAKVFDLPGMEAPLASITEAHALQRLGRPEEVAAMAAFLLSLRCLVRQRSGHCR